MLNSLLDETSFWDTYGMLIILVILIAVIVVFYVISSRRSKKREKEAKDLIDAVKPGNKVKTIGGICGIVVEVDKEENTFVLETGTELSGKCYIKFDKQAIYQTDAVIEHKEEDETTETSETATEATTDAATEKAAEETAEKTEEVSGGTSEETK